MYKPPQVGDVVFQRGSPHSTGKVIEIVPDTKVQPSYTWMPATPPVLYKVRWARPRKRPGNPTETLERDVNIVSMVQHLADLEKKKQRLFEAFSRAQSL
jgi:hypothetical protein